MHIFESFEEMERAELDANRNLTPGQIRMRDDVTHVRYFARLMYDDGIVIYGKVPPVAETQKVADFDVLGNRARGYLTGKAYSKWEPKGEPGDTHVYDVIPIDPTVFVAAQTLGWPDVEELKTRELHFLARLLIDCEMRSKDE